MDFDSSLIRSQLLRRFECSQYDIYPQDDVRISGWMGARENIHTIRCSHQEFARGSRCLELVGYEGCPSPAEISCVLIILF